MQQLGLHIMNNYWFSNKPTDCVMRNGLNDIFVN